MKQLFTSLLAFSLFVSPVLGDGPIVILQPDGSAWLKYTDRTEVIPASHVVMPPGDAPPDPEDPDDPDPPVESDFSKVCQDAADAIGDPASAKIMGDAYYGVLADQIESGVIPADPDSVDKAMTAAHEVVSRGPKWKKFHVEVVIPELGRRVISGETKTAEDYTKFFREVQTGLNASAEGAAIPPWLQPLIAALIQALIELLTNLFGGQTSAVEVPDLDTISASELAEYLRGLADG